jgi:hypothetical protein
MRTNIKHLGAVVALITLGISMTAYAGLFGIGGTSWKEEVVLHDGTKIVVERDAVRRGRHEIGQAPPIGEETLSFAVPESGKRIVWKAEYSKEVGSIELLPMQIDIVLGVPYLVTSPAGCLAYNKWKRPNPPYVVFRYLADAWHQIELKDLPDEIKTPNLIISSPDDKAKQNGKPVIPAADIFRINVESARAPEYGSILRKPLAEKGLGCPRMIPDGQDGWIGVGTFERARSLESCKAKCANFHMTEAYCPCEQIFKEKK